MVPSSLLHYSRSYCTVRLEPCMNYSLSLSLRQRLASHLPISSSLQQRSLYLYSLKHYYLIVAWSFGLATGRASHCLHHCHAMGSTCFALSYQSHWSMEFPYEHRQQRPHWHSSEQTAHEMFRGCWTLNRSKLILTYPFSSSSPFAAAAWEAVWWLAWFWCYYYC